MESYLKEIDVWCWIYLETNRNYRGLHFTAKPAACGALLECIEQLRRSGIGSKRTVPLRPLDPMDEEKISGGKNYRSFRCLRIFLHDESDTLRQFSFRVVDEVVQFDLTERYLFELEKGIRDVKSGVGDYSIAPRSKDGRLLGSLDYESECLWFWPCFGHLSATQ